MKNFDVVKFGGTSLLTHESVESSVDVACTLPAEVDFRCIVVSAIAGVTDMLVKATRMTQEGSETFPLLRQISDLHLTHIAHLNPKDQTIAETYLAQEIDHIWRLLQLGSIHTPLAPQIIDYITSAGERFVAPLFVSKLIARGVAAVSLDANHVFATDNKYGDATVLNDRSRKKITRTLLPATEKFSHVVIPGY